MPSTRKGILFGPARGFTHRKAFVLCHTFILGSATLLLAKASFFGPARGFTHHKALAKPVVKDL